MIQAKQRTRTDFEMGSSEDQIPNNFKVYHDASMVRSDFDRSCYTATEKWKSLEKHLMLLTFSQR